MSDHNVWDMETLDNSEVFDYVEYSVGSWRAWISKAMLELDKIEMKEIRLLAYFSIIEMMAQDHSNFPTKNMQGTFTQFILKFQNKYDYLELTDPITLYYRAEGFLSSIVTLDSLEDGGVYYPNTSAIRTKVSEIQKAITVIKGIEYSEKKSKEHRYVDLLYRMRCRLSHEFSAPHMSVNESMTEPYYINCSRQYATEGKLVSDEVWQLLFPVSFVKNLCLNCFDNYLKYCLETRTPPNKNNGMDRLCELSWYNQ